MQSVKNCQCIFPGGSDWFLASRSVCITGHGVSGPLHPVQDRRLASHVLSVHKEGHAPAATEGPPPLSPELLRAYVAAAKSHDPFFPEDLTGCLSPKFSAVHYE